MSILLQRNVSQKQLFVSSAESANSGGFARRLAGSLALLLAGFSIESYAEEAVDEYVVARIKEQASQHSQIEETLHYLADVYGPRLTGTPRYLAMVEWAQLRISDWGIERVYAESFGADLRGWEVQSFSAVMTKPVFMELDAQPVCCSDSTAGAIVDTPLVIDFYNLSALQAMTGKLRGRILLHEKISAVADQPSSKWSAEQLATAGARLNPITPDGLDGPGSSETYAQQLRQQAAAGDTYDLELANFLISEGVAAVVRSSSAPAGLVNNRFDAGMVEWVQRSDPKPVPFFVIPREKHARLLRLNAMQQPATLALQLTSGYYENADSHVNLIAEIPGSDKRLRDQIVYLGAHLDSVEMATGAADNGIGAATSMEVFRVLSQLKLKPRRTIRLALWGGEEYGLLGSKAHAEKYYGDIVKGTLKPAQKKVSAYFNHDNNGHDIRGIFLVGHEPIRPIFEAYLEPFTAIGANTVTVENAGGTDILVFDALGIPSFEWIHDPLYYFSHQLHTSVDTTDLVDFDSARRNAAVIATVVYHAAMRDELLPRKIGVAE